jgi:hypothetical protein
MLRRPKNGDLLKSPLNLLAVIGAIRRHENSTAQAASLYGNVGLTNNFNDDLAGPLNSQTSG